MSQYSDIINQSFGRSNSALPQTVGNIDEDPDRAQRALDLAKATGVPSTVIYGDLDEFERQHKAVVASDIVANNPHLSDFVQSDPMVPKLANDDYGTLDSVSQKVSTLGLARKALGISSLAETVFPGDPLKRWKEGGPLGSWITPEDAKNYPMMATVATVLGAPIELAFRGLGGGIETMADAAKNIATAVGGESLGRDIGGLVEAEAMGLTGRHPIAGPVMDTVARVRPWVVNGKEPPPTVLPEYDQFRAKQNAEDVDALKEATSEAQQSLVRERSPELFKQFINQHTDAEIGISGEAVAALYGDKLPTPDDGVLGWVSGIQDKLALARETGTDVSIPLSAWLAHAEPEVMQALHDDIRVRPGGITANEVKLAAEVKEPPPLPIAEPVPSTRAAAALEPLYSVGDRKLSLLKLQNDDPRFGGPAGFHDFELKDEKGNTVGGLNILSAKDGKQLYVENITGVNGLGPRDFGPALMRDLLRQLKAEFPDAETITGHRVSGARDKAGSYMAPSAQPVVKLDNPKGWETAETANEWRRLLEGGRWETYSSTTQAYIKPYAERSLEDRRLIDAISQELDRVVPRKLGVQETDRIQASGTQGQRAGDVLEPTGTYIPYKDAYPILLYSLEGADPLGTARHEAIHHLRGYGFFKPEEWAALERASKENGWVEQFNIEDRYPTAGSALRLEESIADAYKEWENGRFEAMPEVQGIFEKMKAFFEALRKRIGELLGKEPSWEDIFQKVSTGEVGAREGKPLDARAFDEKLSAPDGGSRVFERAAALGMTVEQFKAYDRLISKRHGEDIEAATKRAETDKARELTKEWKANRKDLRQEVSSEIKQRPDVAADLFLGAGELYGKKLTKSVKLDSDALTDAQKAMLPRSYYGKDGVHPDDVANLFGYGSGDAMIQKLGEYNVPKTMAKMSARDFVSRVTDIETDRQMQIKYGNLDENIMDAVKEQVVGQTQLDILHEETHALGMKVGAAPLQQGDILQQLWAKFDKMTLGSVSSDAYMRAAGKAGRAAELALLADDPAAAYRAKQQQYYATVIAKQAAQLEKELGKFDKIAKRFSAREVSNIDPQYTNFIHDILQRVGKPVRRSIQDLETEIQAGEYKSLQEFVEGKQSYYLREVAVADMLFDPAFRRKFEDLTVDEFNAVNTSIKSMIANGRDELKITKAGQEADLNEIKGQMINELQEFQQKTYDAKGGRWMLGAIPPSIAHGIRSYGIAHIQMETLLNRWDRGNPDGVFQQYIMRDLADAASSEVLKRKEYAERLAKLDDKAKLKQLIDNPLFRDPDTNDLMQLNRGNLRAILLNAGNKSNLDKMARGYGLKTEEVMTWLRMHATPEDWTWGQKMGDLFADLKDAADTMYRGLSGVAPESIPLEPIDLGNVGSLKGWYYPLIAHPEFEAKKALPGNALEGVQYVRATTPNGYTKARTGATYPLALDLDMLPGRIGQMIHDIEMRPAIINAAKIFYDKDFKSAVRAHFGSEWRDMLEPYLVDVANSANYMPRDQRWAVKINRFAQQNIVSTLVGMNPGTVLKHMPTAAVQSLQEVGAENFLRELKGLFSVDERTGENNWQFAMKTFSELQIRHQNYMETLGGAADALQPSTGYAKLRATIQSLGATPVAMSDLLSAVPTALAEYRKALDEGRTEGDAVYLGNRAVRRAHGSVIITNRSRVMRMGPLGSWMAQVYGFFNHIMNRQYELLWQAGDRVDEVKSGEKPLAMQDATKFTGMIFSYVIAPALIEEMVSPLASTDGESWGKKAVKGLAFTLGASWVGVRDIASALLNGRDPTIGLLSTEAKTLTDFGRDLAKSGPFSKEHAGKIIRDGATLLGGLTGLVPAQTGRVLQFMHGVNVGTERPKGPWGWMVGARYGTLTHHSGTFQEWQKHH